MGYENSCLTKRPLGYARNDKKLSSRPERSGAEKSLPLFNVRDSSTPLGMTKNCHLERSEAKSRDL